MSDEPTPKAPSRGDAPGRADTEAAPQRLPTGVAAPEELCPSKAYPPIGSVENGELQPRDMLSFVTAAINQDGLVGHNLHGYNDLIENGINRIMTQLFDIDRMLRNERTQTEADRKRKSFQVRFQFHDVKVGRPTCTTYLTGQFTDLYPGRARLTGLPYSGPVTLGATATVRAYYEDGRVEERTAEIPPFQIGGFPTMVGGVNCHTANCPRTGLKEMGEDPTDPGGYFIAKRNEYVVDLLENIRYNCVHIHRRMKANEHVRAEFLSQPGGAFENSSQIRVRFMTNGQITIEINSTKFEKVRLPFYLIYRLFGMTDDRTVTETIVFDAADTGPITTHMLDILERAFQLADATFAPLVSELNRERLVQMTAERVAKYLTNPTAYLNNESAIQFLNEDLLGSPTKPGGLDKVLLPHMGQTAESRIRKLRFLGLIIHKMFLVHLGVLPPTDRDSYRNKRVHGAGVSLAKAFKTQVNNSIVIPIFRAIKRELKNNPWESVTDKTLIDTFRNALTTSDLNRAMEQAITAGNKTIVVRRRAATNRVSSQALERKNGLNTFSALRTVVTQNAGNASKATERADMMRRVHPTYVGFICVAQSADTGENVGMRKQLAITASVCTAGEALPLKLRLLADGAITALDFVASRDLLRRSLARVFVNGEWIGVCDDAQELVARYRGLRREGRIVDPHTTVYWDPVTDEVEFWLDVGRLRRPLLIVDSNVAEYDAALRARHAWAKGGRKGPEPPRVEFVQNVRFTPEHARAIVEGRLTLADLVRAGVAEYVTPEEQENCLLAESIGNLRRDRHDVTMQYSHCDIEQAIFGLAAHVSPFGNHTQPARVTYETNQGRQTGGWYVLNFPFRTDKNRFFQFYNEIPLVRTLTHKLVPANGTNVIIAYASYGGDNQEDSAIVCQAAADRGLFAGAFFRFEIAELEKGESFCNPDALTTKNLKPNACYEKLADGFIRVGSVVRYGDVLIGRVAKLSRGRAGADDRYQFTDRSVVYRLHEPAVVEAVLRPRGANDELFGLVKLRYERPLRTGDKMSSRSGNKSIVALMLQQSDMPFTETGLTPDMVINTHSFPSRMTIGQLIETSLGKVCARKGVIADGTAFLPVDHLEIAREMKALGFRYNGRERMYNGMTGNYFDAAIFIGPTAEQRLQKFVLDDEQSVAGSGPTDATTGQPLGGKHVQGGLRLGEMENWGLESHGSMLNLFEKTSTDSDGRKMHVCRGCGALAVFNEYHNVYQCRTCGELADLATVDGSKSAVLLHEELAAANIHVRLGLRPREFEVRPAADELRPADFDVRAEEQARDEQDANEAAGK
jgi:DNA-directed RNA polymerase beta subunit